MAEQLFGYSRQELLGNPIEMLIPPHLAEKHVKQREGYFAAPRNRPMGVGLPLSARRKDGSEFPVEISLSTVQTRQGQLTVSFITDITSRTAADRERENLTSRDRRGACAAPGRAGSNARWRHSGGRAGSQSRPTQSRGGAAPRS